MILCHRILVSNLPTIHHYVPSRQEAVVSPSSDESSGPHDAQHVVDVEYFRTQVDNTGHIFEQNMHRQITVPQLSAKSVDQTRNKSLGPRHLGPSIGRQSQICSGGYWLHALYHFLRACQLSGRPSIHAATSHDEYGSFSNCES